MQPLEEKLGYTFQDKRLLENALTHSSYANEHRGSDTHSNERLEFLGDSILGLVVADHLYRTRPDLPEGDLTRIRAALVCENSLVEVAQSLDLGSYLRLGKGEDHGGGRARPSIQADAVEALLAAVYLDGGIGQARKLIHTLVLDQEQEKTAAGRDYKTRCWSTTSPGSVGRTMPRSLPWRSASTASPLEPARGTARRRPSRLPPKLPCWPGKRRRREQEPEEHYHCRGSAHCPGLDGLLAQRGAGCHLRGHHCLVPN